VSGKNRRSEVKLNRKVLYRFAIFAIINEKLKKIDQSMRVQAHGDESRQCNMILGERRSGELYAAQFYTRTD